MDLTSDVTCSEWLYDLNTYTFKSMKYWIYRSQIGNSWYMSNFNFNLTDIDLKTTNLDIAEKRAYIILNTKYNRLNSAISTLTRLGNRIRRKSLKLSPQINENLINFADNMKNF